MAHLSENIIPVWLLKARLEDILAKNHHLFFQQEIDRWSPAANTTSSTGEGPRPSAFGHSFPRY